MCQEWFSICTSYFTQLCRYITEHFHYFNLRLIHRTVFIFSVEAYFFPVYCSAVEIKHFCAPVMNTKFDYRQFTKSEKKVSFTSNHHIAKFCLLPYFFLWISYYLNSPASIVEVWWLKCKALVLCEKSLNMHISSSGNKFLRELLSNIGPKRWQAC